MDGILLVWKINKGLPVPQVKLDGETTDDTRQPLTFSTAGVAL